MEKRLSHLDQAGAALMVDVSAKERVRRTARARAFIELAPATLVLIRDGKVPKGEVLACARIAGIMAAKRTAELIPLCHNIEIERVEVELELQDGGVEIRTLAACTDKTGIEMEALTAATVAALTIWDMCKAVDKGMRIREILLVEKTKEAP